MVESPSHYKLGKFTSYYLRMSISSDRIKDMYEKLAVYTTTRVCLYHPATRMWLYPKPRVLDTATRLMTAQSKGCTATLLGTVKTLSIVWRNKAVSLLTKKIGVPRAVSRAYSIHTHTHTHTHTQLLTIRYSNQGSYFMHSIFSIFLSQLLIWVTIIPNKII